MKKTLALLAIISAVISFSPAHTADPGRQRMYGPTLEIIAIDRQIGQLVEQVEQKIRQSAHLNAFERQRQMQEINELQAQIRELSNRKNDLQTQSNNPR